MKYIYSLVGIIKIKLSWNLCTSVHSNGLELLSEYLPASRQTLKLGYLDTTYIFSGEVETLSCYWYDPIIMKLLSEQFFLELFQKIICVSHEENWKFCVKFDKLYISWFPGGHNLRLFWLSWNSLRLQFWNLEQIFWNFVRNIICKKSTKKDNI